MTDVIARIPWTHEKTRSFWSGLTGYYEVYFDGHEWVLGYLRPGSTAQINEHFPNRSIAMDAAQSIHNGMLRPLLISPDPKPDAWSEIKSNFIEQHRVTITEHPDGEQPPTGINPY